MLTEMLGRRGSRLLPVVVMIAAAALLAGAPHAHADGHPTPAVSTEHPSPTGAETIAFRLAFDKLVDLATFDASDISVSSGTVQNLHSLLRHDGNIEDAGFDYPSDVAVNASGYIYVADARSNRVAIFDPDRRFNGTFPGDFNQPGGVTIDGSGNVYVADTYNHRIKIFDSALRLNDTIVRDFNHPFSVAVDDASGRIYVADTFADRVQVFHANWSRISYMTGFNDPYDVAVDGSGNLHVAVALEDRVRIFNSTLDSIHNITSLNRPRGVAVDSLGTTYVANTAYNQIRIYDTALDQVASIENSFTNPYDVAIDGPRSTVYVADRNRDRIQVFNMTFAFEVANPDDGVLNVTVPAGSMRDAAGNPNAESNTVSIAIDRTGPVPFVNATPAGPTSATTISFRVDFKEDVTGFNLSDVAVSGDAAPAGGASNLTNSSASVYAFDVSPAGDGIVTVGIAAGAAADAAGNPSEAARFSIRSDGAGPTPAIASTVSGPANPQSLPFTMKFSEAVDAATLAASDIEVSSGAVQGFRAALHFNHAITRDAGQLDKPRDVAVDGFSGTIYVASSDNNAVLVFNSSGNRLADLPGPFNNPWGVEVDASGRIYVANYGNSTVQIFDSDRNHVADLRGPIDGPSDVAVDGEGRIYVANWDDSTVRVFDSSRNYVAHLPGQFDRPVGVAVDASTGHIYTAEPHRGRVQIFDSALRLVGNITGIGDPLAVAADGPSGAIYVADGDSDSVKILNSTTRAHVGDLLHHPLSLPKFGDPYDVAVDASSGTVYVADTLRDRVMIYDAAYEFSVDDPADGQNLTVSVPAGRVLDAAGNPNAESNTVSIAIATGPIPTVASLQGLHTNAPTINFTVTFDEPVTGFNASAITLSGDANPGPVTDFDGSGAAYAFSTMPERDGTVTVRVAAGAVRDAMDIPSLAADLSVTYDTEGPSTTVTADQGSPTSASAITFTVMFSDTVSGFNASGIEITGTAEHGGAGDFATADNMTYTFVVAPTSDGTILVDVPAGAARDLAGNDNTAAERLSITRYAALIPTIASAQPDPTNAPTISFTVNFTRPVTGFEAADVAISGIASGIDENSFATTDNMTYTFAVSPASDGTLLVDVPANVARDAIGNNNTAAHFSMTYDTAGPIPTVASLQGLHTNAPTINFTVTFDENVTGFTAGNVTLSGDANPGPVADFDGSGAAYAFSTMPTTDGTILVEVAAGAVRDALGNPSPAADLSVTYDTEGPSTTVTADQGSPTNATTITFTVRFSDPVAWFNASGIEITGTAEHGGAGDFTTADNMTYTFVVTTTSDGTIRVDVPAGAARDLAGNDNAAAVRLSITRDALTPTFATTATGPASLSTVPFTLEFSKGISASTLDASDIDASSGTVENLLALPKFNTTFGGRGTGAGQFQNPSGVAVDGAGNVYVSDEPSGSDNDRVQVFDSDRNYVADLPGPFDGPAGVAVDGSGNIYVANTVNRTVQVFDSDRNYVADLPGSFSYPYRVAADGAGNVYVTDAGDGRVRIYDSTRARVADLPFGGASDSPTGVAADGSGNVYVAYQGNNTVQVFDSATRTHVAALPGPFDGPDGVATDAFGNVYVANSVNDTVQIFDSDWEYVADLQGTFDNPTGVAAGGPAGSVYVVDRGNHAVQAFVPAYAFDVANPADMEVLNVSMQAGRVQGPDGNGNVISNTASIEIDRTGPTPIISAAQSSPTNASPIGFEVDFREPVDGFEVGDIALSGTARHGGAAGLAALNATAYSFDVSPTADGTILVDIPEGVAQDKAGNDNAAAERFSIEYDGSSPIPAITASRPSPTGESPISFTVTFSDPVAGFEAADVALSGTAGPGPVANFTNASATTYTFDVVPSADGTVRVDVPAGAARDALDRPSTKAARFWITYDGASPTPTIAAAAAPGPASLDAVPFTVKFDEDVGASAVDASAVDASSGTVQDPRLAPQHVATFGGLGGDLPLRDNTKFNFPTGVAVDGSGNIYVADTNNERVQVFDSSGNYSASLPGPFHAPRGIAVDGSGNIYVTDIINDTVRVFDSDMVRQPGITGTLDSPDAVAVDGAGNVYVLDTTQAVVQIFDSERAPVANLTGPPGSPFMLPAGVAVDGSGNIYVADTNNDRVLAFGPDRNYIADLPGPFAGPRGVAADGSGNVYVADTGNNRTKIFDSARNYVADLPGPFNGPAGVAVDGAGRVYVSEGRNHTVSIFDTEYAFNVTGPADGDVLTVTMPAGSVRDAAGNPSIESNTVSITIDRTGPIPTVASLQGLHTNASTINFTVTFDEPVTGFDASAIALSGDASPGPVADFNGSGAAYAFSTMPAMDGIVTVRVAPNVVQDALGNPSPAADLSVTYDTEGPTATITADQPGTTDASTITFTVRFSDPVAGFNASSIAITGTAEHGGASNFTTADNMTYTFVVTTTSDGTILVDVPAGAARDLAGNDNAAAERLSITRDALTPTFATTATGPASLSTVPFTLEFSKGINASTLDASDIDASSGTVENLLVIPKFDATIGGNGSFGGSGTGPGEFANPGGVAVDGSGNIYVADGGNNRVQIFGPDRMYVASLPGTAATPNGAAVDGSGNVYVTNGGNGTVQVFGPDRLHAASLLGSTFLFPNGVAVDGSGNVYVADTGNGTVKIFDSTTRAYVADLPGPFSEPSGVAVGGSGNVYVTNTANNTVQVFDSGRNYVADLPGPFNDPLGVAVDAAGSVYVTNIGNDTVQVFGPDGEYVVDLRHSFTDPVGVAAGGPAGSVYVVDKDSHRVHAFVPAYRFDVANPADEQVLNVSMQAGRVQGPDGRSNAESNTASIEIDRTGPTPIISAAQSSPTNASPIGFEVDFREPVGGFEVGDIALSGTARHGGAAGLAALNATAYSFDVSPTVDGTILVDIPEGVAQDKAGNDNAAAERFSIEYDGSAPIPVITAARPSPTGESPISFTVTFSDPVTMFEPADVALSGTAGPGPVANFTNASATTYTFDVAPSADGTVRVDVPAGAARDALDRPSLEAARFWITYDGASPTPTIAAAAAPGPASLDAVPFTVKFDEDVGASAVDASAVDASSGTVQDPRLAPQHVATFGGLGGGLPLRNNTQFNTPSGVAVDGSGNIYVADTNNNRVQMYDSDMNYVATLPGTLKAPRGVALDDSGNIYVTDPENDVVHAFDPDRNALPAINSTTFVGPDSVAVDGAGNVYVLDVGQERVKIFDSEKAHVANLTGQPGSRFSLPGGVAVDDSGNVYVADTGNDRVQVFDSSLVHVADLPGPFDKPRGVAVDGSGNVYVADTGNNMTKIFDSARNHVADLPGPFNSPRGVAADGAGRIYVVDSGNHSIRVYDAAHAFDVANPDDGVLNVTMPAGSARDAAGNPSIESNTVSITIDRTGPIPTVASPQGLHTNAPTINFTVTFDEPVTGFTAGDIALSGDASPGNVIDFDGSGAAYEFSATPAMDGIVTVRVAPNVVQDALGNPSIAANLSVTYDTEGPSTTVTADQPGTTDASTITFTVRFSDPVAGFAANGIEITGTAEHGGAANFTTADNMTYTFVVTPTSDGTIRVDVPAGAARDLAGNDNAAAERLSITRDSTTLIPTIASAQPDPTNAPTISFTVNFTRPVTGFEAEDVAISGIASGIDENSFATADNMMYTFAVSPTTDGTLLVDVPANVTQDANGNNNTAAHFSMTYDTAGPIPTVASQQGLHTNAPTINFTVTFDEPVTGFTAGDIALSVDASPGNVTDFDGSGAAYEFSTMPAMDGTILVDVAAGAVQDALGNPSPAADLSVTYDTEPPTATITADRPGTTGASTITFTVRFSDPVTGFGPEDVVLSGNATRSDVANFTGSGDAYTFDVALTSDGTILVDVPAGAARDLAGNDNDAAERLSITYAAVAPPAAAPVPTITSDAGPGPATESPIAFTVTFDKPVTGFDASGIEITGAASGIVEDSFVAVSATTYTFAVSPTTDGAVTVDVPAGAAVDSEDGTASAAAAQFSIEYAAAAPPAAAPVPTITSDAGPGPATESPIAFTVTFDKPVTGFDASGIEISGIASGIDEGSFVTVNATTYAFTVSPTTDGTVTVDIAAGAATGEADGTASAAAAQFSIEYAGAPPAAQLVVESAAITGPQSITIRYDADANATDSAYGPIVVGGTPRSATLAGAGTDTHVLRFDGDPAARDATGTVTINQTAVTDPAGRPLGNNATYQLALADGQAPVLASAVLDLTAGENGLLTVTFDEAVAAAPDAPLSGEIMIRGDGGEVALSGSDVPSVASGRAGGATFALDISGAKRIELNAADLRPDAIELPAAFVSDAPGNSYAPGRQPAPLAYAPDTSPPRLAAAAFNLAPAGAAAGRLVITFDEAATAPGAESFPGMIEIRGRSWGGDASVSLSADDVISVESGSTGDRTFVLLVSDRARAALDATAFSDLESTTLLLPAGFVTDGRSAHAPERAPLDVARDPDRPSFLLAFVLNGSSIAAVYSEPVLAVPSHYANITVDGAAVAGNRGGASEAAAFGNNVIVSWNANASTTAAAGSAVGFDLSANVTDAFGNPVENPGAKSTGGPDGTGQAGKQPVQVGVFARGAGDPSMGAARLGAAAFNAVSEERGYQFYVSVSEHDLPAGAPGAAALRGAHASGEGPSLYVGPASDIALAGMAGYASENGITIISHSSAARSLAVGGDPIFRMEPGAAHMARALATEVARGGYGAIVPVVQAGLHGPDYGLLESLESDIGPLGISFGEPVEFAAGGGGAAAAPVETAVAAAAGSGTARSVAVVYVGSDAELAAMAGSAPAGGAIRERSAWFAVGGAGAGAGSGVAASPAITADAAAIQLARDTRLSAVQFAVERNSMTDYIDRIAAPLVPAASATPAYAAYEAVRALGGALVGAGGDPSLARGNIAGAANLEGGPLGRTGVDGNGDLRLPVTYGIWSVSDASAEWARAPELLRGLDACGIDLEKSALALPELSAGSTSRPARQTVTNIGTGPMPAVSVSATDWTQFRDGAPLPGPLPFSYTEMAVGLGGASPRPADSTPLAADTAIPGGTPPGGSVDVDFRINLGDLDTLEADTISQTVTFVANCV